MVLTRASAKAVEARSSAPQHSIALQHSSAPQHFEPKYEPQDPCADCGTFWELTGYDENSGVPQYEKRAW